MDELEDLRYDAVPILTGKLAQRIERCVAPELSAPNTENNANLQTVVSFGRTIASKTTGGRPANSVFCFGQEDIGRFEEILNFYSADGLRPSFYVAPMGFSQDVGKTLTTAGFSQQEFEQAILYGIPSKKPKPTSPAVTIERVTIKTLDEFVQITAEGFEWPHAWREAAMEGVCRGFAPDAWHFLIRNEDRAIGVGSLVLRDGVAMLTDSAIVPRLRGKGHHLALIQHRLHVASVLGCQLVIGAATFGSTSFRNQQRAGLRLAYVESGWK